MNKLLSRASFILLSLYAVSVMAVTVPNTLANGTAADADDVNANFTALVNAVTALEAQVVTLQASNQKVTDLTGRTYCMVGLDAAAGIASDGSWGRSTGGILQDTWTFTSPTEGTLTVVQEEGHGLMLTHQDLGGGEIAFQAQLDNYSDTGVEAITYTVVGNKLTVTFPDGTDTLFISNDGSVLVTSISDSESDAFGTDYFHTIVVGVQADSCN